MPGGLRQPSWRYPADFDLDESTTLAHTEVPPGISALATLTRQGRGRSGSHMDRRGLRDRSLISTRTGHAGTMLFLIDTNIAIAGDPLGVELRRVRTGSSSFSVLRQGITTMCELTRRLCMTLPGSRTMLGEQHG